MFSHKRCHITALVLVGIFNRFALGEPPVASGGGWAQQAQQAPAQAPQGWTQPAPQQTPQGWGAQPTQVAQGGGWGAQQQQSQTVGWAPTSHSSQNGGKGGVNWEYNFALGYQGEKGGRGGWGKSAAPPGWSSQPETNIIKPGLSDIFGAIISFPREIKNLIKESGLWIFFLPLLVIIPLFFLAFKAGKFYGETDEGWGEGGKGLTSSWHSEWDALKGFIADPRVQRAAKGLMDELVASRILSSIEEEPAIKEVDVASKRD